MRKLTDYLALLCVLLAGARLVWVLGVGNDAGNADFRYVWMAGDLWWQGIGPYGPEFTKRLIVDLPQSGPLGVWMYPPHWMPIAMLLAMAPFAWSFNIWLVCSTLILVIATIKVWKLLAEDDAPILLWLAFALTLTAVTGALSTGQPVTLAYVGVCLIVHGVRRHNHALVAAGAFLALLKLQVGFPFVLMLILRSETRRGAVMGALATAAASLPSFIVGGTQGGYLSAIINRSAYAQIDYNTPMQMNGLTHVIARVFAIDVSVDASLIVGAFLAAIAFVLSTRGRSTAFLITGVCSVVLIVGLHTYDLLLTLLLLPYAHRLHNWQKVCAVVGFGLLWRPENLASFYPGALSPVIVADVTTAASILICAPFLTWLLRAEEGSCRISCPKKATSS